MSWDVLIKGGTIVDGSGRPAYGGDVAIEDGRIAAMGRVDGAAKRTIDASGLAVAPGFLDVHTHYDAQLAWDPYCTPSCFHGVTTVLMGNCGFAMAPVADDAAKDYLVGLFAATEQVPRSVLEAGVPFAWKTYPEFLYWLRRQGLGINVMAQVGHSALRTYVMGEAALERAATPDEIARMAKLAAEGLAAGAAGVSTSQVAHQRDDHDRHIPTYFAEDPEIIALARTIRESDHGFMCMNPRTKIFGPYPQDGEFMAHLAEVSGAPITWNEFGQRANEPNMWRDVLGWMEAAIDAGRPIYAIARSMAQEPAFDLRGASPVLANLEGWADFGKLDPKAKMAALRNPEQRARLAASLRQHPQFGAVYVKASASDASRPFSGRKLADIARQRGADAADLLLDVAAGDNLETWFGIATDPGEQEEVIEPILKSKAVIVGISDAGAHVVRVRSDFPSWFLSHWVRDKGAFTLEEGVRQLTSVPAGVFRLQDRGRLEPGCAADVTLFDPATIAPGPLEMRHDLPANGRRVYNQSAGIPWVLVNGEPVVEQGALTSARAGELLA